MMMVLALSTIMGISSTQWMMMWVCLEINSLSMCFLMSLDSEKEKYPNTSTMQYYFIQVLSSLVIIMSSSMEKYSFFSLTMMLGIMAKMGMWPLQGWYLKIISILEMKHSSLLMIMTWQKILPMSMMLTWVMIPLIKMMMMTMALLTMMVPIKNLKKSISMKSILALSSVNNNGWLIVATLSSLMTSIIFLTIYSLSLAITLKTAWMINTKNFMEKTKPWEFTVMVSNMGGLPPMMMFWAKLIIIKSMMMVKMPSESCLMMILMACYFLYHYMMMSMNEISMKPKKDMNSLSFINKFTPTKMVTMSSAICMTFFFN